MATLCITNTIAEARDNQTHLVVVILDVEKAFDIVHRYILKIKLNHAGIKRKLWLLIDDLYDEERVWSGKAYSGNIRYCRE